MAPAASHPAGSRVFNRIGCNDCHTRAMTTGANANPALDRATFHPFSDFLLRKEAILGYAGEGEPARSRFIRLKSRDRAALLRFLGAL